MTITHSQAVTHEASSLSVGKIRSEGNCRSPIALIGHDGWDEAPPAVLDFRWLLPFYRITKAHILTMHDKLYYRAIGQTVKWDTSAMLPCVTNLLQNRSTGGPAWPSACDIYEPAPFADVLRPIRACYASSALRGVA